MFKEQTVYHLKLKNQSLTGGIYFFSNCSSCLFAMQTNRTNKRIIAYFIGILYSPDEK